MLDIGFIYSLPLVNEDIKLEMPEILDYESEIYGLINRLEHTSSKISIQCESANIDFINNLSHYLNLI